MKKYRKHLNIFILVVCLWMCCLPTSAANTSKNRLILRTGQTYTLRVKKTKIKKKIKWKSSKPSVASVNRKTGKIKAKKPGKCIIYGKAGKKKYKYKVTVKATEKKSALQRNKGNADEKATVLDQGCDIAKGIYCISTKLDRSMWVDVCGYGTANGTNIQLWSGNGSIAQKFEITQVQDGWYKICNPMSGKCLDVCGASKESKTNVQLFTYTGNDAQLWRFYDAGDGYYFIQNKLGCYLDVANGKAEWGGNIWVYRKNSSDAQKWRLAETKVIELQGIGLNSGNFTLNGLGKTKKLEVTYSPADTSYAGTPITWSSSNKKVATVSGGTVKAVGSGTATITAKAYNGKAVSVTATVKNTYEYAWFPAPVMNLTQIAYEKEKKAGTTGASHGGLNAIDILPGGSVFAPFTGKIVDKNADWGYVLLQSTDKVQYPDGTTDYMTVGFMHDSDISDLKKNDVIKQGKAFYQAGGMGKVNGKAKKDAYPTHVEIRVFKGKVNSIPTSGGYFKTGNKYAFDAFYINKSKTKSIKNRGKMETGNYLTSGKYTDWSKLWKNLP